MGDIVYDSYHRSVTKWVTIIMGREDWRALEWVNAFYKNYYCRWGVPQRILTDRGKAFLSDSAVQNFADKPFGNHIVSPTAHGPQADGQSEGTNQIIEIALCHVVAILKTDWTDFVEEVEFNINNNDERQPLHRAIPYAGLNAPNILDNYRNSWPNY